MKINPKCILDILIFVEERSTYDDWAEYNHDGIDCSVLANYPHEEIIYHIRQCHMSRLLSEIMVSDFEDVMIKDLTPEGHEFLRLLRSDRAWKKAISKTWSSLTSLISFVTSIKSLLPPG